MERPFWDLVSQTLSPRGRGRTLFAELGLSLRWPRAGVRDTGPLINKLKTTPTPNKNGSYGIKGGGSYAIEVGLRMP